MVMWLLTLGMASAAMQEDGTKKSAIKVKQDGDHVTINATAGRDDLIVLQEGDALIVYDLNTEDPNTDWYATWEIPGCASVEIFLGEGDDRLRADYFGYATYRVAIPMTVHGGAGDDHIEGGSANDVLRGEDGNDVIEGNEGDDEIRGNSGADVLSSASGANVIYGGSGADILTGGIEDDQLFGQGGHDEISGRAGDDLLEGGRGRDGLYGGAGADMIYGGRRADYIEGNAGDDKLYGNDANHCGNTTDTVIDDEGDNLTFAYPDRCTVSTEAPPLEAHAVHAAL